LLVHFLQFGVVGTQSLHLLQLFLHARHALAAMVQLQLEIKVLLVQRRDVLPCMLASLPVIDVVSNIGGGEPANLF
jgi:hypothetical protein